MGPVVIDAREAQILERLGANRGDQAVFGVGRVDPAVGDRVEKGTKLRGRHAAMRAGPALISADPDSNIKLCTIWTSQHNNRMTPAETLTLAAYFFVLIILAVYGWHRYYLVYLYMRNKDRQPKAGPGPVAAPGGDDSAAAVQRDVRRRPADRCRLPARISG